MPSAFMYKDELRGVSFVLSRAIIKKELSSLQGEVDDSELVPVSYDSDNLQLRSILNKLNFVPRVITPEDLELILSSSVEQDIIPFLFSLNKSHFKAIVYLLHESFIGSDGVREILQANFQTRTELLLKRFEFGEEARIDLFDQFLSSNINDLVRDNSPFEVLQTGRDYPDIATEMTPDEYYAVRNVMPSKNKFNESVKWQEQAGLNITSGVRSISLNSPDQGLWYFFNEGIFLSYPALGGLIAAAIAAIAGTFGFAALAIVPIAAVIGWGLVEGMNKYRKGGIFGAPYKSYLEYLRAKSQWSPKTVRRSDSLDHILNNYLPEYARLRSIKSDYRLNDSLVTLAARAGASRAISDDNNKPYSASAFHHLYFAFNNTNNYNTMENFDFSDFSSNASNAFRAAITSAGTDAYDLSYVDDSNSALTPLREKLERVFPELGVARSSSSYIRSLILSSIAEDGALTKSKIDSNSRLRSEISSFINFNLKVDSTLKVTGMDNRANFKEYAEEAIRLAMIKVEEEGLTTNVLTYGTYNDAKNGISAIKTEMSKAILAQTSDTTGIATSSYNKHLVDERNLLARPILAELVDAYLDYLVDTAATSFSFVVSESSNTNKIYKVLNFAKHIFSSSSGSFYSKLEINEFQAEFDLLLLTIRESLRRDKFFSILEDGISQREISGLFSLGEKYFESRGGVRIR